MSILVRLKMVKAYRHVYVIIIMSLPIIRFETFRPLTILYADVVYKSKDACSSGMKEMASLRARSSSMCSGPHTGSAPLAICACIPTTFEKFQKIVLPKLICDNEREWPRPAL